MNFRSFYEEIMNYKGKNIFLEMLECWDEIDNAKNYLLSLKNWFNLPVEDSWNLYSLSRILDVLTLHFQPDKKADGSNWSGINITINEYVVFVKLLGLEIIFPTIYRPFDCEILESVENKNNFEIIECLFPTIMLKNLLIKRGGVIVSNNSNDYNLNLINNAKIFWAYRRKNRKYEDLSHGWGSNSQWRTEFRLDIETEDEIIYNIQGEDDLNNLSNKTQDELRGQKLEINEAIELLINRQFIKCTKDDNDVFPYDFKYRENKQRANGI
jgi:hypothetical protein